MSAMTTSELRREWGPKCATPSQLVAIPIVGGARVVVNVECKPAFEALHTVMQAHNYQLRRADTGAMNCRPITGGTGYSLHAFGIAGDYNWKTNPYGPRLVTDMDGAMIDDVYKIRTNNGVQVFRWGGYYAGQKDAMHFEVVCSRGNLATGIDLNTVDSVIRTQLQEKNDMLRLLIANPSRTDSHPELQGHWFKTEGTAAVHCPTQGHASELKRLGLMREDSPMSVSPNFLWELGARPPV